MMNIYETTFEKPTLFYYNKGRQKKKSLVQLKKNTIDARRNSTTSVEVEEWLEI